MWAWRAENVGHEPPSRVQICKPGLAPPWHPSWKMKPADSPRGDLCSGSCGSCFWIILLFWAHVSYYSQRDFTPSGTGHREVNMLSKYSLYSGSDRRAQTAALIIRPLRHGLSKAFCLYLCFSGTGGRTHCLGYGGQVPSHRVITPNLLLLLTFEATSP